MLIDLRVIPNAKKNSLKKDGHTLRIYLTSPAREGRANKDLIDFLARHLKVRKNQIEIIKGLKSRNKTVNITEYKEVSLRHKIRP